MMWALNIILKHTLGLERKQQSFHVRLVRALESGICKIMFFSVSYLKKNSLYYTLQQVYVHVNVPIFSEPHR